MAVHYVDLDDTYDLRSSGVLNLELIVGDGQPHYSVSSFLNQERIGTEENIRIGTVAEVRNKKLMIVVVVQDRLQETNWTSFTATLKQGSNTATFGPYKKEAENHMDTIIYTLKISIQ
jgi:hypothetical protein